MGTKNQMAIRLFRSISNSVDWAGVYMLAAIFFVSPVESFWGSFERMRGTLIIFFEECLSG